MNDQPKPAGELPCGCTIELNDRMSSSVFWNEFNKVVQCHKCGHVYEPKQYPNPTTGEWTAEWLRRTVASHWDEHKPDNEIICRLHNAALAAEREKWQIGILQLNKRHNEQLVAEKDERAILERSRDAWKAQTIELAKTLAADALAKVKEGK
jgi:hypothetical protein